MRGLHGHRKSRHQGRFLPTASHWRHPCIPGRWSKLFKAGPCSCVPAAAFGWGFEETGHHQYPPRVIAIQSPTIRNFIATINFSTGNWRHPAGIGPCVSVFGWHPSDRNNCGGAPPAIGRGPQPTRGCSDWGRVNVLLCFICGVPRVHYLRWHLAFSKVRALVDAPRPQNTSQLRSFLGFLHEFLQHVSTTLINIAGTFANGWRRMPNGHEEGLKTVLSRKQRNHSHCRMLWPILTKIYHWSWCAMPSLKECGQYSLMKWKMAPPSLFLSREPFSHSNRKTGHTPWQGGIGHHIWG